MTVHMIRVVASPDGMTLQEMNDALDTWVANHSEWEADTVPHQITEENTPPTETNTKYYGGNYRFELADSKDNLLQKCGDKLKNKIAWYRLGYHECGNDRSNLSVAYTCAWDDEREWTDKNESIPSGVPDFL